MSDFVWSSYTHSQQLGLVAPRAEFLIYGAMEDRVTPPTIGGGRFQRDRFGLLSLLSTTFMPRIMEVFENRRDLRERQMCSVGCEYVISLDFCAHTGKLLGGNWLCLATNEQNNLIGSLVTQTTGFGQSDIRTWLQTIAARPNFCAKVPLA